MKPPCWHHLFAEAISARHALRKPAPDQVEELDGTDMLAKFDAFLIGLLEEVVFHVFSWLCVFAPLQGRLSHCQLYPRASSICKSAGAG